MFNFSQNLKNPQKKSDVQPLAEFHRPTGNCRIVEFERAIDNQSVDVELWDISGDLAQGI